MDATGNIEMGLDLYEQAKAVAEAEKFEELLAVCYAHLAGDYNHLGQGALARKYAEQALEIDQRFGNKQGLSRDFFLLGQLTAKDDNSALEAFQESFLLARSIKDIKNTVIALDGLAGIYRERLQVNRARQYYEEALALCRELGDKRYEIRLTLDLATLGQAGELFETFERSLVAAKDEGLVDLELDIQIGLAHLCDQRGDHEGARVHYQQSVVLLEQMRLSFKVEEHLRAFSESHAEVYDRLVDLSLMMGRETEAFKYSELARGRVLNNLRRARKVRPVSELQGDQLAQYRSVCDQIVSLDLTIQRHQLRGLVAPEEIEDRLRRALVAEAEIVLSVKRSAAQIHRMDNFDVVDLQDFQAQLRGVKQNVLVVAYYTTDRNSYVFVIGKDSFEVALLGMDSAQIRELVQGFRAGLGLTEIPTRDLGLAGEDDRQHKPGATRESWLSPNRRLHQVLIGKVESRILAADHICIIPHGPLHFLPFHALHDGTNFLIEHLSVSYAPSVTTLSESLTKQFTPVENVLALGDPLSELRPLPCARQEVETIETLLGNQRCRQVSGTQATRDLILNAGAAGAVAFDCWHLAMHGVFVQSAPHLSYLQFASGKTDDGRVYAFEIASMDHVGRLSVLSACQTAMTRESPGDELSGLLFSFMAAGAQAVIASLWSVSDDSTAVMMQAFYKHLTGSDPTSVATALQRALLALLARPETASPYYWAPFVLHGNWNPFPELKARQRTLPRRKPAPVLSEALTRAEILLREGESHLARGRMAAEKKPWALLSDEERSELDQAIGAFSRAIEIAPGWSVAYRQRGVANRNRLEGENAVADLKRAVELNPEDASALACLGLILAERKQEKQSALASLERALSLDRNIQVQYPRVNTARIERTLEGLRAEKAVAELTLLLAGAPGDSKLLVERGNAYWQLSHSSGNQHEDRKRAEEDFSRALELNSQCALSAVRLSWMEYSNHKAGAIAEYVRIVAMDPHCAEAHLRLADACNFEHEAARALIEYRSALACDPDIRHAYCGLGKTYLEQSDLMTALQMFETERDTNPSCFDSHLYLKEIYGALGRYDEAEREYQECLRTTEHALYEGKLGVDVSDEVTTWIRKLVQQQPAKDSRRPVLPVTPMAELQRYLARGNELTKAGHVRQAIGVYSELLERDPAYALVYAYRGGCYGIVGQHEKAFADFRKAIELNPECGEAYFNQYVLCQQRGELDIARQCLDRAVMLDPGLAKRTVEESDHE